VNGEPVYLSHRIRDGEQVWPGDPEVRLESWGDQTAFRLQRLTIGEHSSTHLGAPSHYGEGAAIDGFPAGLLHGRALVLRFEGRTAADPIGGAEIREALARLGDAEAELAIVATGWARRWGSADYFSGHPGEAGPPGLDAEAAELLAARGFAVVGIDGPNIDAGGSVAEATAAGRALARRGVYHLENLTLVPASLPPFLEYSLAPLRICGGSGSPCTIAVAGAAWC